MPILPEVAAAIHGFRPRSVDEVAAGFAREVVAAAAPQNVDRAKSLLFACSKLGAFGASCGLELRPEVLLHPSVIERFIATAGQQLSPPTRRTVRTNLRHVSRRVLVGDPGPMSLPRERSKAPYAPAEIGGYLALGDAQPTEARRMRAGALICLGAGAGLMGTDLRSVAGTDIVERSGGVIVVVGGRRPRPVPVLAEFHSRLLAAAAFAQDRSVIGGSDPSRHNITTPLISSLAGGTDLARLDLGRLRATWLVSVAGHIGLRAFMDAAGICCSQRLGDLIATLAAPSEPEAVSVLGGTS